MLGCSFDAKGHVLGNYRTRLNNEARMAIPRLVQELSIALYQGAAQASIHP